MLVLLDARVGTSSRARDKGNLKRKAIAPAILLLFLWVLIGPGITTATRAQTQGPQAEALTLPQAVEIALRSNPLVRETAFGREMAEAQLGEARGGRLPFVQFGESVTRGNNPVFVFGSLLEQGRFGPQNLELNTLNNPDSLHNLRTSLTFRLPIFDQKQTLIRINQAELARKQADAQSEIVNQQIRFEVVKSFYGVLVTQAKKEVADEAVRLAEADVKRAGDLFDTGLVVQSDLLAAQVQLAEFRQQQIQAGGDEAISQALLNTALGLAVNAQHRIVGELGSRSFDSSNQEELIRLGLEHRPEIARTKLSRQSAREGIRGAQGELFPRLDVFGGFGVSGRTWATGSSDYTVGASLTFNVFDAGRKSRLARARANEEMAAANQDHIASQIRFEIVRAFHQYVSARERVGVASRVVEQAGEALRIIQDRYQSGLTTMTEVLRAETTFVRSRMTLLAARYDYYVGYAEVLRSTGKLTDVEPFVS
ncbi:MAG: TolC family protein [Blastocatellia bacterium]